MKTGIHPEYVEAHVRCTCGNEFTTRSTQPEIHVEICSNCHPFYTGRQKLVDTGGRVERFKRRAAKRGAHGDIEVKSFPLTSVLKKHRLLRLPIVRGVVALGESLVIGFKALGLSANAQLPDEEEE